MWKRLICMGKKPTSGALKIAERYTENVGEPIYLALDIDEYVRERIEGYEIEADRLTTEKLDVLLVLAKKDEALRRASEALSDAAGLLRDHVHHLESVAVHILICESKEALQ